MKSSVNSSKFPVDLSTRYGPPAAVLPRGFTLVEVAIVLAIIAVLAAAVAPAFMDFIDKGRVKQAAEGVYGFLIQGKSEGTVRGSTIYFNVENAGTDNWCIGFSESAGCSCDDVNPADISCRVNVAGSQVVQAIRAADYPKATLAGSAFAFAQPRGNLASGASAQISVSVNQWQLNALISPQGSMTICNPDAQLIAGYPAC